jgi:YegS/Rv2252/BmrU family lipid kinase
MRAVILLNDTAGRGSARKKHEQIRAIAEGEEIEVRGAPTPEAMEVEARRLAASYERVIAAGGDGTVHRVLNGLFGTGAALGIIPAGSGNDLAVNLGIPRGVHAAISLGLTAPVRKIDLCHVMPQGRYYACIASFGIDSHANRVANEHRGPFRGTALYVWSLLVALAQFQPPEVTVTHDDGQYRGPIMLLAAANAASYGGGLRIAPGAQLNDGFIHMVAIRRMSRTTLLRHFPKIFNGSHVDLDEVTYILSRRLRIEADRPLDIFADGEFVGQTPATIEVLPEALRVIAPT